MPKPSSKTSYHSVQTSDLWLIGPLSSVINPSTGEKLTAIPEGMPSDVDRAVEAAHVAFNTTWGLNIPGFERGKYLIRIAELIERDIDILASIETLDNGKTFSVAKSFDVNFSSLD